MFISRLSFLTSIITHPVCRVGLLCLTVTDVIITVLKLNYPNFYIKQFQRDPFKSYYILTAQKLNKLINSIQIFSTIGLVGLCYYSWKNGKYNLSLINKFSYIFTPVPALILAIYYNLFKFASPIEYIGNVKYSESNKELDPHRAFLKRLDENKNDCSYKRLFNLPQENGFRLPENFKKEENPSLQTIKEFVFQTIALNHHSIEKSELLSDCLQSTYPIDLQIAFSKKWQTWHEYDQIISDIIGNPDSIFSLADKQKITAIKRLPSWRSVVESPFSSFTVISDSLKKDSTLLRYISWPTEEEQIKNSENVENFFNRYAHYAKEAGELRDKNGLNPYNYDEYLHPMYIQQITRSKKIKRAN